MVDNSTNGQSDRYEFCLYRDNPPSPTVSYAARNEILFAMGFRSYAQYLESEVWKRIRKRVFAKCGIQCRLCGSVANYIHHLCYSHPVLEGKNINRLSPLCKKCHDKVELDGEGRKRSLTQAYSEYIRLLRIFQDSNKKSHGSIHPQQLDRRTTKKHKKKLKNSSKGKKIPKFLSITQARRHLKNVPYPPFSDYAERNALLITMGYSNYEEYLGSDAWKAIKTKGFARHGRECRVCKGYATLLHHVSYNEAVILGNDIDQLVPLCEECHKKIEFDHNGSKRGIMNVYDALIELLFPLLGKTRIRSDAEANATKDKPIPEWLHHVPSHRRSGALGQYRYNQSKKRKKSKKRKPKNN